jgi:predicted nucleotidyltransferase
METRGDRVKDDDRKLAEEFAARLRDRLGNDLVRITLFGSRARGNAREGSDFDVLVVVTRRDAVVREKVLDVEVEMMDRHGVLFSAMLYADEEWSVELRYPIGRSIASEGVQL